MSGHPEIAFIHLGEVHEQEYPELEEQLLARGVRPRRVHLEEAGSIDWSGFGLVSFQMCRGLHLRPDFAERSRALLGRLAELGEDSPPVSPPPALLPPALDKRLYLRALERRGVELIPSHWRGRGEALDLERLMRAEGWDDVVVKPTRSARSWNTFRIRRGPAGLRVHVPEPSNGHPGGASAGPVDPGGPGPGTRGMLSRLIERHDVVIQRFMPEVLRLGELSFVFLGGRLSHTICKQIPPGKGWTAHELFGAVNLPVAAAPEQRRWANTVYRALADAYGGPLHARIDAIPDEDGRLRLLECELVAPRLFLREGEAFGRYAEILRRHLKSPARPAPCPHTAAGATGLNRPRAAGASTLEVEP